MKHVAKNFVGARVHFLYLLVQTNIVYDSYSRGKYSLQHYDFKILH